MSIRPRLAVARDHVATPFPKLSLSEEVRELRKLAKDRRAASLALFRTKHPASPRSNVPPRRRERVAA